MAVKSRVKCLIIGESEHLLASLRDANKWNQLSGGVAALNHRLIAVIPSGSGSNLRDSLRTYGIGVELR